MEEKNLKLKVDSGGSPLTTLAGNNIKDEVHGYVEVSHGLNEEGDYIWHFSPHRRERLFPENLNFFYDEISKGLDPVLPVDIKKIIYPPPGDWEKRVISIVAKGVGKLWSFDEDDMGKNLPKICKLLSDELERLHPRKKGL